MDDSLGGLLRDPFGDSILAFIVVVAIVAIVRAKYPGFRRFDESPDRPDFQLSALALAVIGGVMFALTLYLGGSLALEATIELDVDMQIAAGPVAGIYLNDATTPVQQPVVPGARHVYRFPDIPSILHSIRIDPTLAPNARVSVYGVTVISEGSVVGHLGPADLKSWSLYNLKQIAGDPAAFNVTTSSTTPKIGSFMAGSTSIVASHRPESLLYVLSVLRRPHLYPLALVAFFLLFLIGGLSTRRGSEEAAVVAVIALVAGPIAIFGSKLDWRPPAATIAIGDAGFAGYPWNRDHLVAGAILATALVVAWFAGRRITVAAAAQDLAEPRKRALYWDVIAALAVFVCCAFFLRDFRDILAYFAQAAYQPIHWDYNNFLWWQYLVDHGHLPYRDFWYPYSGFYANLLPFPTGASLEFLQEALAIVLLYLGLRFSIGSPAATLVFLAMIVPIVQAEFLAWNRYVLGIDIALLYVSLQQQRGWELPKHLTLAFASSFVFFYEPAQLAYAGVGMLVHTAVVAVIGVREKWNLTAIRSDIAQLVRQRLFHVVLPLAAGIVPVIVFLALSGMLPEFVRYQASIGDQAVYGSQPAPLVTWTLPVLRFEVLFTVPFIAAALGIYASMKARSLVAPSSVALLVVGIAGFMSIQKDIVRPVLPQTQIYACVAVMLYVVAAWKRRTVSQVIVVTLFFGFLAGLAQSEGVFTSLNAAVARFPALFATDLGMVVNPPANVATVNANAYAPERFTGYTSETAVVHSLTHDFGWNKSQPVFVLGDESVLYILLGSDFPYVSNNYNSSPIDDQERIVAWLQQRQPRFVVWHPGELMFDMVPNLVRVPLIYQYVVENYSYARTIGPYDILTRGNRASDTDAKYWEQRFGMDLDMGDVPRLTPLAEYRDCPGAALQSCQRIVVIHTPSGTVPGKGQLSIESTSGAPFRLTFEIDAGAADYVIDVDRLWFRSYVPAAPKLVFSIPGAQVQQEARRREAGILY